MVRGSRVQLGRSSVSRPWLLPTYTSTEMSSKEISPHGGMIYTSVKKTDSRSSTLSAELSSHSRFSETKGELVLTSSATSDTPAHSI